MTQIFFREIKRLKTLLLEQGEAVEEQVRLAKQALLSMDVTLAKKVLAADDAIDQREVDLQEECFKILALHQPVAVDLRFLVAVLKFNNDLERIADLAANVAKRTVKLKELNDTELVYDFAEMAAIARQMLHQAMAALVDIDAEATADVFSLEKNLNRLHKTNSNTIRQALKKNPERAESLVHQLVISRNMERIGDLATNLAEEVIYVARGEIVRHSESPL
ncbi:phosphate signaling complex protein PhoU [Pelovirga terrestris]|uniref:Phosphate-specific transport system accessory protein PhoU n=1 Tax=Pelovirga terrestris TaxID=2771352 RepID=A0A8J6UHI1_9BACT|nr:phosphate signaling complex protein PhoU [Pelovirga terrestris]MBD1401488.1 phosphate signaling complex protein PhoU [Pelovirga terrestris]MBW6508457.1 phosphate signaling complex protein PhoU [Desulfuromonadales bacterium]